MKATPAYQATRASLLLRATATRLVPGGHQRRSGDLQIPWPQLCTDAALWTRQQLWQPPPLDPITLSTMHHQYYRDRGERMQVGPRHR